MKRGLLLSFFIRIAIALGFVALIRIWFTPHSWILWAVLLIGWAAINAYFLARSVRQNITRLEVSTAAIPDRHVGVIDPSYSDFDGLAHAISVAEPDQNGHGAAVVEGLSDALHVHARACRIRRLGR